MQYKYKVSFVIPVYNCEEYINKCVDSIIKQKFNLNDIEVILINDGSTDNSLKKCKEYVKKYNNFILIDKKNAGVSSARNDGIKKATGKYIMILDSDDFISSNTVEKLYNFFEKHNDEIDLVTYPIKFYTDGKLTCHTRYNNYDNGSGIYDLDKYYYLNQSTVNIMIKNNKKVLYNEKMKLSEDQNFNTEVIMEKKKIGFCKGATYFYRRHSSSVSVNLNNPYYCFDKIMSYNEYLIKKYKSNNKIPKYIQSLIINTIGWRIRADQLFPYGYEKKEFKLACNRISNILKYLDTLVIMNQTEISFNHKIFLLKLAGKKISVKVNKNKIYFYSDNDLILEENSIDLTISKNKIYNNKLYITGFINDPSGEFAPLELYLNIKYNDGKKDAKKVKLFESTKSHYSSNIKTNLIYGFDLVLDINNIKQFSFNTFVSKEHISCNTNFSTYSSNILNYNKQLITYNKNSKKTNIHKNHLLKVYYFFRKGLSSFKKNNKSIIYRLLYIFYRRKNISLYYDNLTGIDNAYTQFKYDFIQKDNHKKYYVTSMSQNLINKYFSAKEKKYIIKYKSIKHKMLFLNADNIITSFLSLSIYCPFNKSIPLYKDILKYQLTYLQHGILHANLLTMYAKEFTEIDKFIISSEFEKNNLITNYNYNKNDLIPSGMPRMSKIIKTNKSLNRILFAPSWRKYLIGNLINGKRELKEKEFINSKFYIEINKLFNSKELTQLLKDNNLILDFKLHPIFKPYKDLFNSNKYIDINFDNIKLENYKIFITDFSSYQFDYLYLERPIIYFVPDIVEFNSGLHTYRKLDLEYKDAFGNLCVTEKELFNEINSIINRNYNLLPKYKKRINNFFFNINNPCQKIYKSIYK